MKSLNMNFIEAISFNTWMNRNKKNINIEIYSIFIQNIEQILEKKKIIDFKTKLFLNHQHFDQMFFKIQSNKLFSHRFYDYKIFLIKEFKFINDFLYDMFKKEFQILIKYIKAMLNKIFIRINSSSIANFVLFVKKFDENLRFCVDYRQLNSIIIKNKYSLSLMKETLNRICKIKIFIKINIIVVFHKLRMIFDEKWKTIFKIRYNFYEYKVMSFDLANASSIFQHFINDILHEYLNVLCTIYIDDIFIYNNNKKNHIKHVNKILQRFKNANIQVDINKSKFYKIEIKYLNFIVKIDDIKMNFKKIKIVIDWKTFNCIRNVQIFIEFVNFYKRFIKIFSKIIIFLIKIIRKNKIFVWFKECESNFQQFKQMFITTSISIHFDYDKKIILKTNFSNNVFVDVMSQYENDDLLHFVIFFFKKHFVQKINYEIYDKKFLTIIRIFKKWKSKLENSNFFVKMFTNHRNLKWFIFIKQLFRRQIR